jgi:hypothetical protein
MVGLVLFTRNDGNTGASGMLFDDFGIGFNEGFILTLKTTGFLFFLDELRGIYFDFKVTP